MLRTRLLMRCFSSARGTSSSSSSISASSQSISSSASGAHPSFLNNAPRRDLADVFSIPIGTPTSSKHVPSPKHLYNIMDEYVIGQHRAKRTLSVAVHNHYKRLHHEASADVQIETSNVMLIGPTGSGKSLLAKVLSKELQVPCAITDMTTITQAGYVGGDATDALFNLLQAADFDVAAAERGIVVLDEVDKVARKSGVNMSITRDVSGEGVQQSLLKIIEGHKVSVPVQGGRRHPLGETIQIDTRNILFILSGAFNGLDSIIERRLASKRIGFEDTVSVSDGSHPHFEHTAPDSAKRMLAKAKRTDYWLQRLEHQDLEAYGFIAEFVGRIPILCTLETLDEAALVHVLTKPKNALVKQYKQLFAMSGVQLEFTPDALSAIANMAIYRGTGARALRSIVDHILMDVMYEVPGSKNNFVRVTEEGVKDPTKIEIRRVASPQFMPGPQIVSG